MTKKTIQQLVQASYEEGQLSSQKVDQVSRLLKRADLKAYIRAIKLEEKKKTVNIALPSASIYNTGSKVLLDIFPDKKVVISEDKLLMLGAKVTAGDMVYEYSLKQKLDDFIDQVTNLYDEE